MIDEDRERKLARIEELTRERDAAVAAVATARELAFEEAAQAIEAAFEADQDVAAIDVVRALAALDPSLVAVPRETLEQVREALGTAVDYFEPGLGHPSWVRGVCAALAALETL